MEVVKSSESRRRELDWARRRDRQTIARGLAGARPLVVATILAAQLRIKREIGWVRHLLRPSAAVSRQVLTQA